MKIQLVALSHRLFPHCEVSPMNEVRQTVGIVHTTPSTASSKGSVDVKLPQDGNILPDQEQSADKKGDETVSTSPERLKIELKNMNGYVQSIQRNLQFAIDEDLETTIIRVVDGNSGEIIRQIPEDIFLELARRLKDDGEVHLLDAQG